MKFEFNENELKIIAAALQEIPFKLANPVLKNIQEQYDNQNKAIEIPAQEPVPETYETEE